MLPKGSILFFNKYGRITRHKKGWKISTNRGDGKEVVRPSFIDAVRCLYGEYSGRLTIVDFQVLFPRKSITYEDCFKESPKDFLRAIRWAWMGGYLYYCSTRKNKNSSAKNKDSNSMRADICAMRKLQKRFPYAQYPKIWISLEEGCGQIRELLNIPKRHW